MKLIAIDPGPEHSAYVFFDCALEYPDRGQLVGFGFLPNLELESIVELVGFGFLPNLELESIVANVEDVRLAIEDVRSYGQNVGMTIFQTVKAIARFSLCFEQATREKAIEIPRAEVKMYVCGNQRANDTNVREALVDRWGGKETAIGAKKNPGPLYGVSKHVWSALAVAVAIEIREQQKRRVGTTHVGGSNG